MQEQRDFILHAFIYKGTYPPPQKKPQFKVQQRTEKNESPFLSHIMKMTYLNIDLGVRCNQTGL